MPCVRQRVWLMACKTSSQQRYCSLRSDTTASQWLGNIKQNDLICRRPVLHSAEQHLTHKREYYGMGSSSRKLQESLSDDGRPTDKDTCHPSKPFFQPSTQNKHIMGMSSLAACSPRFDAAKKTPVTPKFYSGFIVSWLLKRCSGCQEISYNTQSSITAYTRTRHRRVSWARWIQSTYSNPISPKSH